jgi:hypothetical protein
MKLNNTILLIIIFVVLVLSTFTGNVLEGMENNVSGIKKSEIPEGEEDLYILKSQALQPNCPICPEINSNNNNNEKCPPCPPCGRCPEPAFECKKVPNYKRFSQNNNFKPLLADFSNFSR